MEHRQMTLGEFRVRTAELPGSATLVINVNHGDDVSIDLRGVVDVDIAGMVVEPFAEVIIDCSSIKW